MIVPVLLAAVLSSSHHSFLKAEVEIKECDIGSKKSIGGFNKNQKICVSAFAGFFLAKALADSRGGMLSQQANSPKRSFHFQCKKLIK